MARRFRLKKPPDVKKMRHDYNNEKQKYLDIWRPVVLSRDNFTCRACGSKAVLQLAHVTSCLMFVKTYGFPLGIQYSFREDNLVTLCSDCHDAHHKFLTGERIPMKIRDKAIGVGVIFNKIMKERCWKEPVTLKLKKCVEVKSPVEAPRYTKKVNRLKKYNKGRDAKAIYASKMKRFQCKEQRRRAATFKLKEIIKERIDE